MSDQKKSILVVEDDEQSQKYMRILLSREFNVSIAAGSAQAWEILQSQQIDLILMDLSLHDGDDGLKITRGIRERGPDPNIPIIALTAHAFPEDRKRSLEAGCNDYVSKPFQWVHLRSVIEKYL
ncbi:MAG: response regulator [Bacteroidota bacterium]|jgi:CheY-like chemotaxis protein|nr:response regulator [Bacteroidota bacterium]